MARSIASSADAFHHVPNPGSDGRASGAEAGGSPAFAPGPTTEVTAQYEMKNYRVVENV
jgi:hypothetical protein